MLSAAGGDRHAFGGLGLGKAHGLVLIGTVATGHPAAVWCLHVGEHAASLHVRTGHREEPRIALAVDPLTALMEHQPSLLCRGEEAAELGPARRHADITIGQSVRALGTLDELPDLAIAPGVCGLLGLGLAPRHHEPGAGVLLALGHLRHALGAGSALLLAAAQEGGEVSSSLLPASAAGSADTDASTGTLSVGSSA